METRINDIVLIYQGQNFLCFARVDNLEADIKPGWWQITLLPLKFPLQYMTWILRQEYIDGQEFAMGGELIHIERLQRPASLGLAAELDHNESWGAFDQAEKAPLPSGREMGKVIALRPRKAKNKDQGN
jgi:hypothetical protein